MAAEMDPYQVTEEVAAADGEGGSNEAYKQKKMALLRGPMQLELWMMEVRFLFS